MGVLQRMADSRVAERPLHIACCHLGLEAIVNGRQFSQPVSVFIGLGLAHDVGSVSEAFELLNEWCCGGRGPAHEAAFDACRAAFACECDDETARQAFEAFARAAGILAPDTYKQQAPEGELRSLKFNAALVASSSKSGILTRRQGKQNGQELEPERDTAGDSRSPP